MKPIMDDRHDADMIVIDANEGCRPKARAKTNVSLRSSYVRSARVHMRQAALTWMVNNRINKI